MMEIVSKPINVLLLLLHGQIGVSGQSGHHKLHEVPDWSVLRETLLQVLVQEDVFVERHAGFLLEA